MSISCESLEKELTAAKTEMEALKLDYACSLKRRRKLEALRDEEYQLEEDYKYANFDEMAFIDELLEENQSQQDELGDPDEEINEIVIKQGFLEQEIANIRVLLKAFNQTPNQTLSHAITS